MRCIGCLSPIMINTEMEWMNENIEDTQTILSTCAMGSAISLAYQYVERKRPGRVNCGYDEAGEKEHVNGNGVEKVSEDIQGGRLDCMIHVVPPPDPVHLPDKLTRWWNDDGSAAG